MLILYIKKFLKNNKKNRELIIYICILFIFYKTLMSLHQPYFYNYHLGRDEINLQRYTITKRKLSAILF